MSKIMILTDSLLESPESEYIKVIPSMLLLGRDSYLSGDLEEKELWDYYKTAKELPEVVSGEKTLYENAVLRLLRMGYELLIYTSSKEMSKAYENAKFVSVLSTKIRVVDSRQVSFGGYLVLKRLAELVAEGITLDKLEQHALQLTEKAHCMFALNDFAYLRKVGRMSSVDNFIVNTFKFYPSMKIENGAITIWKRLHGEYYKVVKEVCEDSFALYPNPNLENCIIGYTKSMPEDIEVFKESLLSVQKFETTYLVKANITTSALFAQKAFFISFLSKTDFL